MSTPELPYHRLARTPTYRWWKPLVELLAFGGIAVLLWVIAGAALAELFGGADDGAAGMITLTVILACLLPASLLAAKAVGRPAGTLSSVAGRLRRRWLVTCVLVALIFVIAGIALQLAAAAAEIPLGPPRGGWVGWDDFLPLAGVVVVFVPFQAAAEEYAFRGTLMQVIGAWARPAWVPMVITTAGFAVAHGLDPKLLVAIASAGAAFAWVTIKTGGLEAALALHVLNNVTLFLADAATGRGGTWISELNTDIPWYAAASDVVSNALYAVVIVKLYSRRSDRATS